MISMFETAFIRARGLLAVLVVLACLSACSPALPTLQTESQMATAIAATVRASSFEGIAMPVTWTPRPVTPSRTPVPTAIPTTTPTLTRPAARVGAQLTTPEPTVTPTPLLVSLEGSGNASTESFQLPAGKYRITWFYDGAPDEQEMLNIIKRRRDKERGNAESEYDSEVERLKALLGSVDPNGRGGADASIRKALIDAQNRYRSELHRIDRRYEEQKEQYTTSFQLELKWPAIQTPVPLADGTSISSGTTYYTFPGDDFYYYLIITSEGDWRIKILSIP